MKTFWNKFLGFIILLLPPVSAALIPQIAEGGGWEVMAATLGGVMSLTILLTEPIKLRFNLGDWPTRIVSWVIAALIIYISSVAGWAFDGYEWFMFIISGIGVGLAANGTFTIEEVKFVLNMLYGALTDKK